MSSQHSQGGHHIFLYSQLVLLSNILENKTAEFGIESTNWKCLGMDVEEAILREAKAIYDQTAENADQRERMNTRKQAKSIFSEQFHV